MNRAYLAFAALAILGGTGCVHRELKSFADHPSAPLTAASSLATIWPRAEW